MSITHYSQVATDLDPPIISNSRFKIVLKPLSIITHLGFQDTSNVGVEVTDIASDHDESPINSPVDSTHLGVPYRAWSPGSTSTDTLDSAEDKDEAKAFLEVQESRHCFVAQFYPSQPLLEDGTLTATQRRQRNHTIVLISLWLTILLGGGTCAIIYAAPIMTRGG
ncbi:hypothetical protein BZG36_03158 [Bifiguratus adelaidae]|uniref:Uncharacterized protein n=1 Tax=Bifiguratus adelaidae TaxID=1938954 RepID=A0A261Y155_9FUNG|nr:hypothetical protein BZG36_03158 [Bifiguratus adelaidae]